MSTKPTVIGRWGDVSGDIVEPSPGKKDTGFTEGEQPPAPEVNWLFYVAYLWCQWLYDGDVSFASVITAEADIQHAAANYPISPLDFTTTAGTVDTTKVNHSSTLTITASLTKILKVGDKIDSVKVRLQGSGGVAWGNPSLWKRNMTTRTATHVTCTVTGSGASDQWFTATPDATETVAADYHYWIEVVSGVNGGSCYGAEAMISR